LYIAHSGLKAVLRAGKNTSGVLTVETVVASSSTMPLLGPNDLAFHTNGALYFTDPTWSGDKTRGGVYLRRTSGQVVKVISKMVTPNGIGLSPDERTLYVAQSDLNRILKYEVRPDGTLGTSATLIQFASPATPDGMQVDEDGTIYQALYSARAVAAISPDGRELWRVTLDWDLPVSPQGHNTTNCTLGPDHTLYITRTAGSGRTNNGCLIRLVLDSSARHWLRYR
jgi:gluconolactonase